MRPQLNVFIYKICLGQSIITATVTKTSGVLPKRTLLINTKVWWVQTVFLSSFSAFIKSQFLLLIENIYNIYSLKIKPGGGDIRLWSQHLGGRSRKISVSSRLAWSTDQVPGQLELLHRKTLSQKKKKLQTGPGNVVQLVEGLPSK